MGFANVFEFTDNIGLEANINIGYNIVYVENDFSYTNTFGSTSYYNDEFVGGGFVFNPELKFRYNVLAVGLDMIFTKARDYDTEYDYTTDTYLWNGNKINFSSINFTIGAKF